MSSFINFNNKVSSTETMYSAEVIKIALLESETKNSNKANKIVEVIKEPITLNEALNFFTDKLRAVKSLSNAIVTINEGRVKQFEMDYANMVKDIKKGYGWIDPEYVAQTWDNSSDSIDFELVRDEIFDRLIAAGLLAHADDNNPEEAGKKIKSAKELYAFENVEVDEVVIDFDSLYENYEVIYSDGISAMKKFRTESQALDFMKKEIKSNNKLRDIAVYKPGMHSTTQTELVVKFWGDGSYLDNVSKRDSKLAAKKLEESVVTEAKFDKKSLMKAMKKDDAMILVKGKEYIIYNPNNGNDDNTAMWGDQTIFALDQDGEEHEFKYSEIERFSESVVNEAFSRMSKEAVEGELYAATNALKTYYDWLKAGNDSGKGESLDHIISLLKKCKKSIKRFNSKEEVEGTLYESATSQLADEEKFELYTATLKNKTATLKATTTTKTWDDGVPVLKYLARGKGKPTQVNINGSFEVAHDVARGWFYFTDGRKWFGLHIGDGYSDIDDLPFDMEVKESVVTEAKFVKEFDKAVLDAETEKDVLKVYPKAEFHVGKLSHFFGELEPNLFFKAYYAKYYKQDTGNKIDGEFKITSVYSEKGSNYVHLYNESVVNEGRSINKIQKEWSDITTKMLQKVSEWKEAEGDRKSELLEELKGLTKQKAELEKELDAKVAGKDKDVQLAISEDHSSNPNDKYEVRPCDEEGTPWAVWEGDVRVECFATEEEAHTFADKQNQEQELEEGNAFGAARAEAIAKGEKEFEVDGETFKVEDIDAEDKENAEEFVEESKITLDSLVEMFTEKETITEDLRSEVKKFIKQNNKELDELADQDQWDIMYQKLYDEFEVEADSTKGKDLLKTFQFTY